MMTDPAKVEFLEFCRQVLKGEQTSANLQVAVTAAKSNLEKLKEDFLKQVSLEDQAIQEKCKNEVDEILAVIDAYTTGVDVVDSYLKDEQRATLVRGMEMVRRAVERLNIGSYRYRAAVLASQGPTDMPNYNLFVKLVRDYNEKKVTQQELQNLINAAKLAGEMAISSLEKFKSLPEVGRLMDAFQKHQETLATFESDLLSGKPLESVLDLFRESCEATRDLQGPAQMKILSQGPTPSEAANRMINMARELLVGRLHPYYFHEGLRNLEGEFAYFKKQFDIIRSASSTEESDLLKSAFQESQSGMDMYEKAIGEFHKSQEIMDSAVLIGAVKTLQAAVNKLYGAYKMVSEMAEREGKVLCIRCQHYNSQDRRNCEKCGAMLPRILEEQRDISGREIRDALLNMPLTENIKNILEAGENVSQGNITKVEFKKAVGWMEELVEKNSRHVDELRKNEARKHQQGQGFSEAEEQAYELFTSGVGELRKGLSHYEDYLEKEDVNLIREGARHIVLGANKIYQLGKFIPTGKS